MHEINADGRSLGFLCSKRQDDALRSWRLQRFAPGCEAAARVSKLTALFLRLTFCLTQSVASC